MNGYRALLEVLEMVRRNPNTTKFNLNTVFTSDDKFVRERDLAKFLTEPMLKIRPEYSNRALRVLNTEERELFPRKFFVESYVAYTDYEHRARYRFIDIIKDLKSRLDQQNMTAEDFEEALNAYSKDGTIKRSVLKDILERLPLALNPKASEYLLTVLDCDDNGVLSIAHLTDYLRALHEGDDDCWNYLNVNSYFFIECVSTVFRDRLRPEDFTKEHIAAGFEGFNSEERNIRIDQAMRILKNFGYDFTFWEVFSVFEHIKSILQLENREEGRGVINGGIFCDWLYSASHSKAPAQEGSHYSSPKESRRPSPQKPEKTPSRPTSVSPKQQKSAQRREPDLIQEIRDANDDEMDDIATFLNQKEPKRAQPHEEYQPHDHREQYRDSKENPPSNQERETPFFNPVEKARFQSPQSPPVIEERTSRSNLSPPEKQEKVRMLKHGLKLDINRVFQLKLGERFQGGLYALKYVFPGSHDEIESNVIEYEGNKQGNVYDCSIELKNY